MAININLYPPIVDTYVPAFLTDSGTDKDICRIYFTLSQFNTMNDIKNVQVTVRSQYTNLSVYYIIFTLLCQVFFVHFCVLLSFFRIYYMTSTVR